MWRMRSIVLAGLAAIVGSTAIGETIVLSEGQTLVEDTVDRESQANHVVPWSRSSEDTAARSQVPRRGGQAAIGQCSHGLIEPLDLSAAYLSVLRRGQMGPDPSDRDAGIGR